MSWEDPERGTAHGSSRPGRRDTGTYACQTRIEGGNQWRDDFIEQRKNAIKEAEALIKKYDKQSSNVKNNREFEAINKEIEIAAAGNEAG